MGERLRYLMVPGIGGSGPEHWQSIWEAGLGDRASRFGPASWDEPDLEDWLEALTAAATPGAVVVAHSLGCLAVARWLTQVDVPVAGAFLVAPPDPAAEAFPAVARDFTRPVRPLPVPAVVIASSNDRYSSPETALEAAERWGAAFVPVGDRGHINGAAGLGGWEEGRRLLTAFTAGLTRFGEAAPDGGTPCGRSGAPARRRAPSAARCTVS